MKMSSNATSAFFQMKEAVDLVIEMSEGCT